TWRVDTQAWFLLTLTLGLLFLPKILAALDLLFLPAERAAFGGWGRIGAGIVVETILFTLLAPVLMLFHTKFLILTLCRISVDWKSQRRGRAGESDWGECLRVHAGHTVLGVTWAALAWWIDPVLAAWMSPILAGFILSIPLSYFTGALGPGLALKRAGILQTPEETHPWPGLVSLGERLTRHPPAPEGTADAGLLRAVLDPYVNSVHLSLLRMKRLPAASAERFAGLREKLLREGPRALEPRDKLSLLRDAQSMQLLHREIWSTPARELAAWWQNALAQYTAHHEDGFESDSLGQAAG
ncbi:MAG: glucosyl transferase family 2, partial [Verrucomicrobia bacterium]|nr:glucosyl transferase family 2 [Verrucomicrobiota bacterium]